ncbi:MAG: phosphoenolpyruvate carboxykinase (ATP) [Candidatus Eisenbacteria bacterium]|nr:phosphoenolpyruvate carboxykinase (ATP) [Candidatus Eisenbacteria bacterium]
MDEQVDTFRHSAKIPYAVRTIANPSQAELRELSKRHVPHIYESRYGNLDRITRCKARMAKHTHIIAPMHEAGFYSSHVMRSEEAAGIIEHQRQYIERIGTLIQIDGYQGLGPLAPAVQWLYTPEGANIAGMQQILAFPREAVESSEERTQPFRPQFRLVMTPGCPAPGSPPQVAILVDLEHWTTYVLGSDYFGESKKGMLRMLNEYVYQLGGLVLHAGAKAVTVAGRRVMMAVMGLSGTGKTTTTFSHQGDLTEPVQDDMICLWPDGSCTPTENGCFAKTHGLREESEPVIYRGTIQPEAWVENVYLDPDGTYDFSKESLAPEDVARLYDALVSTGAPRENVDAYVAGKVRADEVLDERGVPLDGWDFVVWTQNGRSIIPMHAIDNAADLHRIPEIQSLGILNRDEGPDAATPGIVRFTSPLQAAAYFMLGETSKTSAAGKDRGKTRSPFTQPFFPRVPHLQARRFEELAARLPDLQLWLMNTGYIGGDARDVDAGRALKVKIRHSSAMLEALLAHWIAWKEDPDFGYEIVDVNAPENHPLVEAVGDEILDPRLFYARRGRHDEYVAWVERIKEERRAFLLRMGVDEEVLRQVHHYSGL